MCVPRIWDGSEPWNRRAACSTVSVTKLFVARIAAAGQLVRNCLHLAWFTGLDGVLHLLACLEHFLVKLLPQFGVLLGRFGVVGRDLADGPGDVEHLAQGGSVLLQSLRVKVLLD